MLIARQFIQNAPDVFGQLVKVCKQLKLSLNCIFIHFFFQLNENCNYWKRLMEFDLDWPLRLKKLVQQDAHDQELNSEWLLLD